MERFQLHLGFFENTAIPQIWWTIPYLERAGLANKMADVFHGVSLDNTEKKVPWSAIPIRK